MPFIKLARSIVLAEALAIGAAAGLRAQYHVTSDIGQGEPDAAGVNHSGLPARNGRPGAC